MTVSYTHEVATSSFSRFFLLLLRWRGSIYKLIYPELFLFLSFYYGLTCLHMFILSEEHDVTFHLVVKYCKTYSSLIPISFLLGFYIRFLMQRWWNQYISLPWPDPLAVLVSNMVQGLDERGRVMRRTAMRYVCLCATLVFTLISPRVKRRFPTYDHLVDAGLIFDNERDVLKILDEKFPKYPKIWVPIVWAASIFTRARREGRIRDDVALKTMMDELDNIRRRCAMLLHYDTISIPLVYTQVVTIAIYTYFLVAVIGQQWIPKEGESEDAKIQNFIPVLTILEFFFYMGWLKVAETLINPFGEDDDDFEINWMIDRHLQVSYLIVDGMHQDHPELVKDQYWDEVFPQELPYQADVKREEPPEASTAKLELIDLAEKPSTATYISRFASTVPSRIGSPLSREGSPLVPESVSLQSSEEILLNPKEVLTVESFIHDLEEMEEQVLETDYFERLREKRERQRLSRQRQRLAKNVNTATEATAEMSWEQQANILPLPTIIVPDESKSDEIEDESSQEANLRSSSNRQREPRKEDADQEK